MAVLHPSSPDTIDPRIVDAAIDWTVKLDFNTPTPETSKAFERWLLEKPSHAAAWQRIQSLKNDFTQVPNQLAMGTLQATESRRQATRIQRRQAIKLLCLTGMTVSVGITLQKQVPWQRLGADYSTATGQQHTISLADGTTVMLNTDTAINVRFTGTMREIIVHRGEIAVSTGQDSQHTTKRPFWVSTPHGKLQALGTRFTTRLGRNNTIVSVTEGAVALHPGQREATAIVRPGESWHFDDNSATRVMDHTIEPASWIDGVIACQHTRLGDLLAELSRYRNGRIAVDADVADLRISGIYHLRDTDQVLRFIAQTQPVTISYLTRFWVNVRAKANPAS